MGGGADNLAGSSFLQRKRCLGNGSRGIDHVIDKNAGLTLHITDHFVHGNCVGLLVVAALVDDRERATKLIGPHVSQSDPSRVGRNDAHLGGVIVLSDVVAQHRQPPEMIDRAVEKPLNLGCVEIHRHNPVSTGRLVEIGHQPGRDGFPAEVFLVLTCIRVEGRDHGNTFRGSPFQGIHHDQLLHDPLVHGCGVGLDHEGVTAAYRFLETNVDL